MKKRDKLTVIYDLLKTIKNNNNSIKPTPLLRYSNLSSQNFSSYLKELQEKEFIWVQKDSKGKKFISLTDKGLAYLEKYKSIIGFISDFGL